jgi:alkylation response protein AidB-like acyl-CoA dehydrogenase
MDFRPTEAQRLLVTVAREFLDKHCSLDTAQELARNPDGRRTELWRKLADLGWPGLMISADYGGSGAGLTDVVLLVEEIGRAALPGPYVPSAVVATSMIAAGGTRAQQERLLPRLATGDELCTVAALEGTDAITPETLRVPVVAGGAIDGIKRLVRDAVSARHLIVVGRGDGGVTAALVDTGRAGIQLAPRETMAGDRVSDITFTNVRIDRADLLGGGWPVVADALARGAVARAAEMVGAAQRILELAVEHAKVRVQSGRPIGSFQAIQHTCADLLRDVEVTRGVVHHAAWVIDSGGDAVTAAAMPKAYAGRTALAVARRAHQIFGAMGYSAEHPLHLLHKRIHAAAVDCGDRIAHLDTVAKTIGLR